MKAARHFEFGPPEQVLKVVDLPPEMPEDDEVVIRMEAAALHIADLFTIRGAPGFQPPLPRTPGFEGIGHVARCGRGVRDYTVGDRVFAALGSGTFREEVRCKAVACLPAPPGDAIQLSLLVVNGATAEVLISDYGNLAPGDWLIQNAANSSCGRYVIRLARERGIRTVNVVRRAELVPELTDLGGDVVLLDGDDLPARVAGATGGVAPKVAFDAVAGAATQRLARCLAPGSTVASYGAMSREPCHLDFYLMFRNDIRLVGVSFGRQFQQHWTPAKVRAMYARLAERMASGTLQARIAGVYGLDDIVAACQRAALTGVERDGKVIIRLG
jgi:NADPH:quinone reductase-like Zn-dependent oxidoreductase